MPITLIKEDGTGKSNANTYASVADCDAYHDAHLYGSAWTAASAGDKDKALAMATRLIDEEFQFNGARNSVTQALQWPRANCPAPDAASGELVATNVLPKRVVDATCEMARELLLVDRTANPAGEGIAMQRLADLSEIAYNKKDRRPILSYPTQALLCKYGVLLKKGMGQVPVVRT